MITVHPPASQVGDLKQSFDPALTVAMLTATRLILAVLAMRGLGRNCCSKAHNQWQYSMLIVAVLAEAMLIMPVSETELNVALLPATVPTAAVLTVLLKQ